MTIVLCPCCSGKEYDQCCKKYHEGALPENALLLMQSRYSAYAINIPEYIIETTHPASPQYSENKFIWKRSLSQFSKSSVFQKLEILDFKELDIHAVVTFTAYISQLEQDGTFTERSYFDKLHNQWYYRTGQQAQGRSPALILESLSNLLPLAYYGDPVLREKADPIIEINSDIRELAKKMIETMDDNNGIGIAAPQIHQSIRMFVIRAPVELEGKLTMGETKVFINPQLSFPSKETCKINEGCLSIPTFNFLVERPQEVTVEYTSLDGKIYKERFSGWEARIIMHEYDHLEGILFFERLTREDQAKLMPHLQDLEKRLAITRH